MSHLQCLTSSKRKVHSNIAVLSRNYEALVRVQIFTKIPNLEVWTVCLGEKNSADSWSIWLTIHLTLFFWPKALLYKHWVLVWPLTVESAASHCTTVTWNFISTVACQKSIRCILKWSDRADFKIASAINFLKYVNFGIQIPVLGDPEKNKYDATWESHDKFLTEVKTCS